MFAPYNSAPSEANKFVKVSASATKISQSF